MLAYTFLSFAFGQEPLTLNLIATGQIGTSVPELQIKTHQYIPEVEGDINCGGHRFKIGPTSSNQGQSLDLKLELPTGQFSCVGSLSAQFEDGGSGNMPLNFQVQQFMPLKIQLNRENVDLQNRTLSVGLDRPASRYLIQVLDVDGALIGEGIKAVAQSENLSPQRIEWTQSEPDPAIIRIKAEDIHGFFAQLDLLPWHYNIPHEDVVFESGSAEIQSNEVYKLTDVQSEIQKVVDRYSHIATVNLYVGGYTDTVGAAANNAILSQNRAQSIANWFKDNGFQGEIFYQGFGESGLAVQTADNIDEVRNRRAAYIVAAEAPPISSDLPAAKWKKLH